MKEDSQEIWRVMDMLNKTVTQNAKRGSDSELDCIVMSSERMNVLGSSPKDLLDRFAVVENGIIKEIFDTPVRIDDSVDLAIDFNYIAPSDPYKRTVTLRAKGEEENEFVIVDILPKRNP